jgi:hypothetical protein
LHASSSPSDYCPSKPDIQTYSWFVQVSSRRSGNAGLRCTTSQTAPIHCLFTAYSLRIRCLFTAYSPCIHCLFSSLSASAETSSSEAVEREVQQLQQSMPKLMTKSTGSLYFSMSVPIDYQSPVVWEGVQFMAFISAAGVRERESLFCLPCFPPHTHVLSDHDEIFKNRCPGARSEGAPRADKVQ